MGYPRAEVRQALARAKADGRDCTGLYVDARDTEITLEKWGFLPIDLQALEKRTQDWYVSQGLAVRVSDGRASSTSARKDVSDSPIVNVSPTEAAMTAAEAALTAAQAALSLARSLQVPAA